MVCVRKQLKQRQPESSGDFDIPLWITQGNTAYICLTDGNKNIRQLRNTSGTTVETYDYDPFGKVSGSETVTQPWQFSSEYFDTETGLVYYNYRYYSPELGRWTKRDPIEEDGGLNLYMIMQNNAIGIIDNKGLAVKYVDCNDQQKNIVERAIQNAKSLANKAYNWIYPPANDKKNKVTFRYVRYFGSYNKARVLHVRDTYYKIERALNNITVNCCCSDDPKLKNTYAYTYQHDGVYEITLCNLFWLASPVGFDSQAGVFIHEMAHEVDDKIADQKVAGHSPYGINNAKFYAEKYAWTAVYNADNYAYFAEACR